IILNGETKTGATLHFADETFDTGDIVLQQEISLSPYETMGSLFNNSNYIFAQMLVDVLKNYEKTGNIPRMPQPQGDFKKAPKVKSDIMLNFSSPPDYLDRLIRSCNPFYGCTTLFRGTSTRIISADYLLEAHLHEAGKMIMHTNRLAVAASGGYLYPKILQVGSWGIFDTQEFVQKFNPKIGERLG
ncbi:methionyl-tRNA formyltransferase, partial [Candidatus Gastranaerophilus sp. (ex Termes propinquus)]